MSHFVDIFDVGSAGGTKLNDKNVRKAQLKPGDVVTVGAQSFEFRVKNGKDIFFEQH
jgi:pSer/pThr/pTyr-binding forkhead associated (FHA) protein